ncbi:MAG: hypothetical protein AAF689_10170 [Pseudomonadota bacterium]
MDFSAYTPFQAEFCERYGWLERQYPFAAMGLEAELRNFAVGDGAVARVNAMRQSRRIAPIDWLVNMASQLDGQAQRDQFYFEFPGSVGHDIARALETDLHLQNFSDRKILGYRSNKLLHRLATHGRAYPAAMKAFAENGAEGLLSQKKLLSALDHDLRRNFKLLKRYLEKQRIKLCFSSGDSKPFSRMLVRASQELGIPFIVFAHGYISDPRLNSIAPLRADALITWTENQASLIRSALPERAADIVSFGMPRPTIPAKRSPDGTALIAWEPLSFRDRLSQHETVLRRLQGFIRGAGLTPSFRPHPKDRKDLDVKQKLETWGFEIDNEPLARAFEKAEFVLSANSTVLTEAAACGIPAIQLSDLATFRFEGAQLITVENFPRDCAFDAIPFPEPLLCLQSLVEFIASKVQDTP